MKIDADTVKKSLHVMEDAGKKLSNLGLDNIQVSETCAAYAMRIGALAQGNAVFDTARSIIDGMERQSRNSPMS